MENAVVSGEYVTFKHVKTRKMVILEIEVPEERFQDVINILGMPIGGESKPVAVALLDKSIVTEPESNCDRVGENIRTRAVLLCKDLSFQAFSSWNTIFSLKAGLADDEVAKNFIYRGCCINSRSELATNIDAQIRFKKLLADFDAWKVSRQYADNFNRQ